MTEDRAPALFDEFVDAYIAGENPDLDEHLRRAGTDSDRLALLIDRFLEVAPAQPADQEEIIRLNARLAQVTPLTEARLRRRLKIDDLVERLCTALRLNERLRPRLRTAYQKLEGEQLDPAGVDERVWAALGEILGVDPYKLTQPWSPPAAGKVFARVADARTAPAPADVNDRPAPALEDDIDRLFGAA